MFQGKVGGYVMRNAHDRAVGVAVLVGLSILATWAMQGYLDRTVVLGSLVCGGVLGLATDMNPILRDLRDLFGYSDPLDKPPP